MNPATKCKLFAYGIFGIVSVLEVILFCKLFNTGFDNVIVLTFIVSFVLTFNVGLWWFRNMYDKALSYYNGKDS
jgi:hypothetical protein